MSWSTVSNIMVRVSGNILQELKDRKHETLFIHCANTLNELKSKGEFKCPQVKDSPFFEEFKFYNDLTSGGVFSTPNDFSFLETFESLILRNEGISSPVDMFKVLLLMNAFGKESNEEIWFGIGNKDVCIMFGAFYNKKLEYVKVKKSDFGDEEKGNAFICSKKELEKFFSEGPSKWIVTSKNNGS